jgi:hypothetical protein
VKSLRLSRAAMRWLRDWMLFVRLGCRSLASPPQLGDLLSWHRSQRHFALLATDQTKARQGRSHRTHSLLDFVAEAGFADLLEWAAGYLVTRREVSVSTSCSVIRSLGTNRVELFARLASLVARQH